MLFQCTFTKTSIPHTVPVNSRLHILLYITASGQRSLHQYMCECSNIINTATCKEQTARCRSQLLPRTNVYLRSTLTSKLMGRVIRSPKLRVPVAPQSGPRSNKNDNWHSCQIVIKKFWSFAPAVQIHLPRNYNQCRTHFWSHFSKFLFNIPHF